MPVGDGAPHGVLLRPGAPADVPHLVALWRRAVVATHDFLAPQDVDHYEQVVRTALPALAVGVAEQDGRVLGFVATDGPRVEMLFVDPEAHARGVGTALLAAATRDLPVVELDVNEQHPGARRFYARRGFREVGRSPVDGDGRPYPLLHLRRATPTDQEPRRRSANR
ncbi:GNAT family N-acetyltransferase [Cellulomonas hominis]|uniref:GNAT family N-acetyltransferase n=1 Tax=Cellulomonas hominis TaxID=156981 RepID=UPI001B9EF360|nr:GNAT family N-acetyltransferase [Cellulomonas hominis]VTR76145.1 putative N-acetyltransferase YjaB [Cellulomonas hominis]